MTTIPASTERRVLAAWCLAAIGVAWFAFFGATFWATTGRIEGGRPSRRLLLLLVLQFFVGWAGSIELLVLVAMQAPFLLAGRALAWFFGLAAFLHTGEAVLELAASGFVVTDAATLPGFRALPPLLGWSLTRLWILAWMAVGAAVGWIVAGAVRSWRELLRVNAEVRASRELLSESARIAERLRVSREVHDSIGHQLAALSQHLDLARRRSDGVAMEAVARALELVRRLLERLRSAVSTMRRPSTLELGRALRTLAEASSDVETELLVPDDVRLAPTRSEVLFDCACEAVGSAVLAGGHPKVTLELQRLDRRHVLTVRVAPPEALRLREDALRLLRERLRPLGGVLDAGPWNDAFRLQVDLPDEAAS
jgi:signal transduction histidine kinase